jgi:hypothetical protein
MENTKRKSLIIVAINEFEERFKLSIEPSSKMSLSEDFVKLTFNGTNQEINELFGELNCRLMMQRPSEREIILIVDETGILYSDRNKLKSNGIVEFHFLHN